MYRRQAQQLDALGLHVENLDECAKFLSQVSYYRLSAYYRYWLKDPADQNSGFMAGSTFTEIKDLYQAEEQLKHVCTQALRPLEITLRARFANSYAQLVGPRDTFLHGEGLTPPPDATGQPQFAALRNLNRSKEAAIQHFQDGEKENGEYPAEAYAELPIWVAVEAFSFGTLSKHIAASKASGVLDDVAGSLNTSPRALPSQIKSFVYLRNRISHCARIWNHPVADMPRISRSTARRASRQFRPFSDHSIYRILVALDAITYHAGITENWLEKQVEPILERQPILAAGISQPQRAGVGNPRHLLDS
ncbi:hypothetical protein BM477_06775 [Boudabousia marimammalium]|uniref:CAAX protease n=1 Tax=Boudabousia marimammalium TaxID=156892 RepID=A0A1Q5PL88_9ACTO|nr:hypothetical protein BM477_06775 [Boudabousia marimammalium]